MLEKVSSSAILSVLPFLQNCRFDFSRLNLSMTAVLRKEMRVDEQESRLRDQMKGHESFHSAGLTTTSLKA